MIVCVPMLRVDVEKLAPVWSGPSMSEIQCTDVPRLPLSRSVAVAENDTGVPAVWKLPSAGDVMVTTGEALIVTVICVLPVAPDGSVAVAVIVCTPAERLAVVNDPCRPIWPSMFDVHTRLAVTLPLSGSLAEPVNVTFVPWVLVLLLAGALMVTVGRRLIVIVMLAEAVRPSLSVAVAVMVCAPALSEVVENDAPVPI